jgi:hypothetical protein
MRGLETFFLKKNEVKQNAASLKRLKKFALGII